MSSTSRYTMVAIAPQSLPGTTSSRPTPASDTFTALGSGGRPIGSLLNPYDSYPTSSRDRCGSSTSHSSKSTISSTAGSSNVDSPFSSCRSTPSITSSSHFRLEPSNQHYLQHHHHHHHHHRYHQQERPPPPGPPQRCGSDISIRSQTQRESCLAYEEEEVCFIWYQRVDLDKSWVEVRRAFNEQFPTRQRSGFQGIQCRYYRYIYDTWGVPKIRQQRRLGRNSVEDEGKDASKKYGLKVWTKKSFPWMVEEAGESR